MEVQGTGLPKSASTNQRRKIPNQLCWRYWSCRCDFIEDDEYNLYPNIRCWSQKSLRPLISIALGQNYYPSLSLRYMEKTRQTQHDCKVQWLRSLQVSRRRNCQRSNHAADCIATSGYDVFTTQRIKQVRWRSHDTKLCNKKNHPFWPLDRFYSLIWSGM